jgi:hypothetical protein
VIAAGEHARRRGNAGLALRIQRFQADVQQPVGSLALDRRFGVGLFGLSA